MPLRTRANAIVGLVLLVAFGSWGRAVSDTPMSTATLELKGVFPAAGSKVVEKTVLTAEVTYTITNFRPKEFFLSMMFESTDPKMTFGPKAAPAQVQVEVVQASGTVRVHGPLSGVYKLPELGRPLRVWVYLTQGHGSSNKTVIAKVGPVIYDVQPR